MKTRYRNKHCEAIHSAAAGLYKTGVIGDEEMRYYDDGCLLKPAAAVSQAPAKKPSAFSRSGFPVFAGSK